MTKPIMYLAIPYSHPDIRVRELRFEIANFVSAKLMSEEGWVVFSPITHSHPLVEYGLPSDWKYWKSQDMSFLNVCKRFGYVEDIKGVRESKGVEEEMTYMMARGIEIEGIYPFAWWHDEFVEFLDRKWNEICEKYKNNKDLTVINSWKEVI